MGAGRVSQVEAASLSWTLAPQSNQKAALAGPSAASSISPNGHRRAAPAHTDAGTPRHFLRRLACMPGAPLRFDSEDRQPARHVMRSITCGWLKPQARISFRTPFLSPHTIRRNPPTVCLNPAHSWFVIDGIPTHPTPSRKTGERITLGSSEVSAAGTRGSQACASGGAYERDPRSRRSGVCVCPLGLAPRGPPGALAGERLMRSGPMI